MTTARNRLDIVINLCGGAQPFASLLGLQVDTVYKFRIKGITPIGILLIERSQFLHGYFDRKYLRPDLTNEQIDQMKKHKLYAQACERQDRLENEAIKNTPLEYLAKKYK